MAYQEEEKINYAQYTEQYQAYEKNIEYFTEEKDGFGKERDDIDKELDSLAGEGDRNAYEDKKQERDTASANYDKADKDLTAADGEFIQFKQDNPEHTAQYEAEAQKESQLKDLLRQGFESEAGKLEKADIDVQAHGDVEQSPTTPQVGHKDKTPDANFKQPDVFGEKEQDFLKRSRIEGQGTNHQTQSADNSLDAQSKEQAAAAVGIAAEGQEQGSGEPQQGDRLAPANDNTDMLAEYGGNESPKQESQAIEYQNATKNLLAEYENEEPIQAANDNEKEQER